MLWTLVGLLAITAILLLLIGITAKIVLFS